MKLYYLLFSGLLLFNFTLVSARAETYDLDDLTGGYTNESPAESPTNTNVSDNVSEAALTLAECLIYQKLAIDDAACDRLMSSLSCPDYPKSLSACEGQYQNCLSQLSPYTNCRAFYQSCTDGVVNDFPVCAEKYPPRQVTGERATLFNLEDSTGDVRVYYEDNPTPADMEAVTSDRTIQTGVAIFTGNNGSVMLRLPNGIRLGIRPNTYFRLADYFTSDRLMSTTTQLSNGTINVNLNVSNDDIKLNYLVVTPLWKITAKGTEFDVTVNDDGTQTLTVYSGTVELLNFADATARTVTAGDIISSEQFNEAEPESLGNDLDLEGDYTLISKLQNLWYTQRWLFIGGIILIILLMVLSLGLVIVSLVIGKRSS